MELHTESLSIAEAADDQWAVASAHGYLGFASWLQADFERATKECTVALRMFRELGDVEGIAWSLLSLGTVARHQGAREQAAALLQESRSLAERIGFREGIAWSLEQLGLLAADRGDPAAAALLLATALRSITICATAGVPAASWKTLRRSRWLRVVRSKRRTCWARLRKRGPRSAP